MNSKRLIIPVGTALAALLASASEAARVPVEAEKDSMGVQGETSKPVTKSVDPVLQRLTYQIRDQAHALTLHRSSSEVLYAQHGSHASHGSHSSHRSSGY